MNFKTHVVGGIGAGVIANSFLIEHASTSSNQFDTILFSSLFVAGSVIGSITPDIDHRGSYIGRRMKIISFLFSVLGVVTKFVAKINYKLFGFGTKNGNNMVKHRGITHTPILVLAIVSLLLFASMNFATGNQAILLSYLTIGFGIGMLSHILLDALTKEGAPLLYPLTTKQFSFLPIRTGGPMEFVIRIGMIVGIIYFIANQYTIQ